jgi:3-hydroxymyristoyl/3-hydroxydecanoyl-(acyl carrier protein) dehydratase
MTRATADPVSLSPGLAPEVLEEYRSEDAFEQRIRIPQQLECWPGHFPGHPVVPGVLQVHWAIALAGRWMGAAPAVRRIEVLKFKQLLVPGRELTLRVTRGPRPESFHFELADGDEIFSTGRVTTGPLSAEAAAT